MLDDLTLIDESTPLPYTEPEGTKWGRKIIMKDMVKEATKKNRKYLATKLKGKKIFGGFYSYGEGVCRSFAHLCRI